MRARHVARPVAPPRRREGPRCRRPPSTRSAPRSRAMSSCQATTTRWAAARRTATSCPKTTATTATATTGAATEATRVPRGAGQSRLSQPCVDHVRVALLDVCCRRTGSPPHWAGRLRSGTGRGQQPAARAGRVPVSYTPITVPVSCRFVFRSVPRFKKPYAMARVWTVVLSRDTEKTTSPHLFAPPTLKIAGDHPLSWGR
eukprot:6747033-Prymnesium_polylepis.2